MKQAREKKKVFHRAGSVKSNALNKILNCALKHANHSYVKTNYFFHQIIFYCRSKMEEKDVLLSQEEHQENSVGGEGKILLIDFFFNAMRA